MKKFVWSVLALGLSAAPAAAQTPPPVPPSMEVGGLVDVYYDYYSTKPDVSGVATYRNFDTKHNQFALSMAEVWLAKAPTASSRVGFKFKLNFGPAATDYIHCCEPGGSAYQNIQEAYASYLAPVGNGLQIDAGVFVTPAGAEVIEAKDNMNYSRGLLFSLAIPYYHSGVRATYAVTDKVSVMGGLTNGWNNIVENNTGKTAIVGATIKPTSALSIVQNYMVGPEQTGNNDDLRHLLDTVVTYAVSPRMTVAGNYDYGHETFGSSSVQWQGIAGYLKFQPTAAMAFSPRLEFFNDEDGFTTGHVQKLKEVTGTLELKASDSLQWRIEYRRDWSDVSPFVNDKGDAKDNQQSIGFGLLYSFAGKIQ
jgi:hypothetical protein